MFDLFDLYSFLYHIYWFSNYHYSSTIFFFCSLISGYHFIGMTLIRMILNQMDNYFQFDHVDTLRNSYLHGFIIATISYGPRLLDLVCLKAVDSYGCRCWWTIVSGCDLLDFSSWCFLLEWSDLIHFSIHRWNEHHILLIKYWASSRGI